MGRAVAFVRAGAIALVLASSAVSAQTADPSAPSGILVLNQERLLIDTAFGQRLQAEIEAASTELAAENRRIEAELTAEELALTELRPTLEPAEFRVQADAFDTRVTAIRAAQDAKARDLQSQVDAAQQRFFENTFPILLQIIESRDGAVLMDSRTVLLSAENVDITAIATAEIDAAIGDGGPDPVIDLTGPIWAPPDLD